MATTRTPDAALRRMLAEDGSRPLVTWYDHATGARVELSVATFANAVAKTANLMVDGLDVQPGERVLVCLPLHWQFPVWLGACWACGAVAVPVVRASASSAPVPAGVDAAVAVVGPDLVADPPAARDVVAVSLDPLGGPFRAALPVGVLDHAVESRSQPDGFPSYLAPGPDDPALVGADGTVLTGSQVMARALTMAEDLRVPSRGRLLSTRDPADGYGLLAALAVPLAVDGSAVLVSHPDQDELRRTVASERVDATLLSE